MSITPIDVAMHHLRADDDDTADVQRKLDAAEEIASQYMGRALVADAQAVTALKADAKAKYEIIDHTDTDACYDNAMKRRAIAMNPAIEAGVLLILGTLYAHREDITVGFNADELPIAATHRLQPYRIMGV